MTRALPSFASSGTWLNYRMAVLLWFCLVALPCCSWAQDAEGGDDNPSITSSLGMPLSAPLNPTHQYTGFGLGVSTGVGYNIDRHNAFVGEFMWNWLFASDAARCNRSKSHYSPPRLTGTGTCLPLPPTTDWSCEAEPVASTSLGVRVGFTAPPASRSLFRQVHPSLVIRFIFGGDTIALVAR